MTDTPASETRCGHCGQTVQRTKDEQVVLDLVGIHEPAQITTISEDIRAWWKRVRS